MRNTLQRQGDTIKSMATSKKILALNLDALMKSRDWSARELSRRTNGEVSDRYIGMLLEEQYNASVEVIDELAAAFGLQGWQLMVPGVPADPRAARHFNNMVQSYLVADEDTQAFMEHVAERQTKTPTKRK